MANTKSAEKAARRAETNRNRNVALRSRMRSALRKVVDAVAAGNKADAIHRAQGSPAGHRLAGQQERHPSQQGRPPQERAVGPRQGDEVRVIGQDFGASRWRGARKSRLTPAFSFLAAWRDLRRGALLRGSLGRTLRRRGFFAAASSLPAFLLRRLLRALLLRRSLRSSPLRRVFTASALPRSPAAADCPAPALRRSRGSA